MNQLSDKIGLVTGATSGIGKAVALGMAQRGAKVIIVARDRPKGQATVAEIKAASGNDAVDFLSADLSSQAAIRQLADEYKRKYSQLHVLVNDAVVLKQKRETSPDGLELMFATNHLAYFMLTNLLLDVLKASAPSSVWNITAPSTIQLNFDDLQGERQFSALNQFGATKMCNLLFTFALARRLEGSGVVANAYHPGLVRSNLMRDAPAPMRVFSGLLNLFSAAPAERAVEGLVQLAATNADGMSGELIHGTKPIAAPPYARDPQMQERLWTVSAQLVGLNV